MLRKATSNSRKNESGFTNSIEMLMMMTASFMCTLIMTSSLASKMLAEAGDLGSALSSLSQSFTVTGLAVGHPNDPNHPTDIATWGGSSFQDTLDFCDQSATCGVRICIAPAVEAAP